MISPSWVSYIREIYILCYMMHHLGWCGKSVNPFINYPMNLAFGGHFTSSNRGISNKKPLFGMVHSSPIIAHSLRLLPISKLSHESLTISHYHWIYHIIPIISHYYIYIYIYIMSIPGFMALDYWRSLPTYITVSQKISRIISIYHASIILTSHMSVS